MGKSFERVLYQCIYMNSKQEYEKMPRVISHLKVQAKSTRRFNCTPNRMTKLKKSNHAKKKKEERKKKKKKD